MLNHTIGKSSILIHHCSFEWKVIREKVTDFPSITDILPDKIHFDCFATDKNQIKSEFKFLEFFWTYL